MERLTDKNSLQAALDAWSLCGLDNNCEQDCVRVAPCKIPQMVRKLIEYEDEEESGIITRIPCNTGDTVYVLQKKYVSNNSSKAMVLKYAGIMVCKIVSIAITQDKNGTWTRQCKAIRCDNGKLVDYQLNFYFENIGKTVFFTREEAEDALNKKNKC